MHTYNGTWVQPSSTPSSRPFPTLSTSRSTAAVAAAFCDQLRHAALQGAVLNVAAHGGDADAKLWPISSVEPPPSSGFEGVANGGCAIGARGRGWRCLKPGRTGFIMGVF